MNRLFLTIAVCLTTLIAISQDASVEKSTFGIQTGLLGIWAHNEAKLTNSIALRSELGFDAGFWGGSFYEKNGYVLSPAITLEPRWYYNLNKRVKKERRIDGNSGNFISFKTTYHPNWFSISNYENIRFVDDVSIIPTWGIRRHIGNHFTYETGIGVGYIYYFSKGVGYFTKNISEVAVNIHVRFGYRFN